MKYILIIFIFASFLFSQDYTQPNENPVNTTVEQVNEYDGNGQNGRPITETSDKIVIEARTQQSETKDYTIAVEQVDEYIENGRPIAGTSDKVVIEPRIRQPESKDYTIAVE